MGSYRMQAVGLIVFLAAFTFIGAGLTLGGNWLLIGLGIALLVTSAVMFQRMKASEQAGGY